MFSFLKKPYPYNSFSSKEILSNFFIGCFVAFFLIVFQPFGVSEWHPEYKLLKLIGFGFVSFICPIIFRLFSTNILKKQNPEETWTVWKETLSLLLVLAFIAFGNLLYGNLIRITHISFRDLAFALPATFLLGMFPIIANVAIKYNRFIILNRKEAQEMELEVLDFQQRTEAKDLTTLQEIAPSPLQELLVFVADNEKDKLELKPEDLLYIESADNYSNVVYIKNTHVAKQLIRSSLKRLETQITFPYILRCHRSYMVNLKQINHIKGNAQGYRIEFKTDLSATIPVSRSYSKTLFERLESFK